MATASNPVDNGVMFFGILPAPPSVTAGQSKVYIRRTGTIRIAEVYAIQIQQELASHGV